MMALSNKHAPSGLVILAMLGITTLVALAIVAKANEPSLPAPVITGWHRSDMKSAPEATPFLGVWADDKPEAEFVIRYGARYWEYAPTLKPPIGAPLYAIPPVWWMEMPGAAE